VHEEARSTKPEVISSGSLPWLGPDQKPCDLRSKQLAEGRTVPISTASWGVSQLRTLTSAGRSPPLSSSNMGIKWGVDLEPRGHGGASGTTT